jgi:hypothetical protein
MKRDRSTPEPCEIPRFVPDEPFPPYAYVPGRFPHPTSDSAGHSFGAAPKHPSSPDLNHWETSRPYLSGVDLFNHGYYLLLGGARGLGRTLARMRPGWTNRLVHQGSH